jgi:hypothetical protein
VLQAQLPQVKPEDAKITLEGGTLTITGERKFDLNRKKDHPVEHARGRFAHSFEVPADARPAKVNAGFRNGVLTVCLAKRSCALLTFHPDVPPFPTLRLNRSEQFNEPEHAPMSSCHAC